MAMVTGDHEAVWLQRLTNITEGDSAVAIMQLLGLHAELRLLRELLVLLRDSMMYPMTMKSFVDFLTWENDVTDRLSIYGVSCPHLWFEDVISKCIFLSVLSFWTWSMQP